MRTLSHTHTVPVLPRRIVREFGGPVPPITVLCGSTRFVEEFNRQRKELTEQGHIVLGIEVVTSQAREVDPQHGDPELKARLDELHMRKIDLADHVLVLNVGGYIGDSTRSEIAYAHRLGKPVTYHEPTECGAVAAGEVRRCGGARRGGSSSTRASRGGAR